jgi:DNA-binding response OmpR family regulator
MTKPSASSKKGLKVLVIEDEKPLAHALELKLKHEGFEPTVALSGTEGMKEALTGQYGLILLDIIMPEIDGFAVLQALKDKKVKTPVLVLSNLGQDEDREKAKGLGARDYLVKADTPILEILKRVKTVLS